MKKYVSTLVVTLLLSANAWAISKNIVKENDEESTSSSSPLDVELLYANFVANNSYAANPSNAGLVYNRYAASVSYKPIDYLFASVDANFFTDKSSNNRWSQASEFDHILKAGYTSEHVDIYLDYEKDRTIHGSDFAQTYGGLSAKYKFSSFGADMSATASRFFYNDNYYARPDNTGNALMRYNLHLDYPLPYKLSLSLDNNIFTDKHAKNTWSDNFQASEWDYMTQLSYDLGHDTKVSLVRETDAPVDKSGLKQTYWALQMTFGF